MTLQAWLLFCATETVLCFTPGPAVLRVVSLGLTAGGRAGYGVAFGILTANSFYFLLSATGIGAALLPQFIDPASPVPSQVALLGISSIIIELAVLALYVAACRRARAMVRRGSRRCAARKKGRGRGSLSFIRGFT